MFLCRECIGDVMSPWTPEDAHAKTHKASTPKKKRQWAHVADSVLSKTGDEGRAIREANAAVAGKVRHLRQGRKVIETESNSYDWRQRQGLKRGK